MQNLEIDHASAVSALQKDSVAATTAIMESCKQRTRPDGFTFGRGPLKRKRAVITVDVEELKCPIDLEVGYSWVPVNSGGAKEKFRR